MTTMIMIVAISWEHQQSFRVHCTFEKISLNEFLYRMYTCYCGHVGIYSRTQKVKEENKLKRIFSRSKSREKAKCSVLGVLLWGHEVSTTLKDAAAAFLGGVGKDEEWKKCGNLWEKRKERDKVIRMHDMLYVCGRGREQVSVKMRNYFCMWVCLPYQESNIGTWTASWKVNGDAMEKIKVKWKWWFFGDDNDVMEKRECVKMWYGNAL